MSLLLFSLCVLIFFVSSLSSCSSNYFLLILLFFLLLLFYLRLYFFLSTMSLLFSSSCSSSTVPFSSFLNVLFRFLFSSSKFSSYQHFPFATSFPTGFHSTSSPFLPSSAFYPLLFFCLWSFFHANFLSIYNHYRSAIFSTSCVYHYFRSAY